ncbi:MAG: CHAT domain-containing tetratricopeptide repeat protein [Bacteroidota bacterium]
MARKTVQKIALTTILLLWLSLLGTSQHMASTAQTAYELYHRNEISTAFALMDSLRFSNQDACDQLEYVLLKTDLYHIKNQTKKAYRYLIKREFDVEFCNALDQYKLAVQKAYLASQVEGIQRTETLIKEMKKLPTSVSDTSSFGIKRLHLYAKVAKHYGRIDECRQLISKASDIQLFRKKLYHPESCGFLRTLGYSYLEEGQFEKAREYFRMERRIYEKHRNEFPKQLGVMFYDEANTHYEQLEFKEAIVDYDSTLFYWSIDPPSKVYLRYVHEALGDLYYELGNTALASQYWSRASEIKSPKSRDKTDHLPQLDTLTKNINFDQLTIAYSDALAFRKSTYGSHHALTGECLTFVGRLNEMQHKNAEALTAFNEALTILIPGFDVKNGQFPLDSLDQINRYAFDALLGMAQIYFSNFEKDKNPESLESALQIIDYAFKALDKVKISFEDSHTALFWSDFTYPITELSLTIHLAAANLSKVPHAHSIVAFQNAEESKSYLLRSFMHKDKVLRKGKLPSHVKDKEQKLAAALLRLKGNIRMEEKRCGDAQQAKIKIWQEELVEAQQKYASCLSEISQNYPDQFNQLFETPKMNTDEFLKLLAKKKTTFVSFFFGKNHIYRFHSHHNKVHLKDIPLTDRLKQLFNQFTNELMDYQHIDPRQTASHDLYTILLGDIIVPKEHSLAIVPDGPLYHIPFEALTIMQPDKRNFEYLLERHPVFYIQSASLLYNHLSSPSKKCAQLLSIAPQYQTPLTFSANDISTNKSSLEMAQLVGSDVIKSKIISQASNSDIIHFAGHSSINAENEMMSQLDLGKFEKSPLHSYEIFDMNLDAALVVLSSCHSGSGKYARGEGVMNLSQAFQQAGSESVILSLWNVDDQSTSELFSNFYASFLDGQHKSSALRTAKLELINSGDPLLSHPYFWSSFVMFGDDDPIEITCAKWRFLPWVFILAILSLAGYWMLRIRFMY